MALKYVLNGDVNGDGKINSYDAMLILCYTAELIEFNNDEKSRADVDGNNEIQSVDARRILQHLSGINIINKISEVTD